MPKLRYFVIIGQSGPRLQEILEELAPHYTEQPGFTTRLEAEQWLKKLSKLDCFEEATGDPAQSTNNYPNSSTHWEESGAGPSIPRNPAPSRHLSPLPPDPAPLTEIPHAPVNENVHPGRVILSPEQKHVLTMIKSGQSVFFTGPAGTGKSVLLREVIKVLRQEHDVQGVAVTAPTGIAGLNIGGSTIHSFAGIGLGKETAEKLAPMIKQSIFSNQRWQVTKSLIIDEISMLDGRLFDKLEYIARFVRGNSDPFGGIQLVITGDFCQLPPVPDKSYQHRMSSTFAFDAESWSRCIGRPVLLTQVFRQKDSEFVSILSAMRMGRISSEHSKALAALSRPLVYADGIEPCHLFATRQQVQACNTAKLRLLEGGVTTYRAMDSAGLDVYGALIPKKNAQDLLDNLVALAEVPIKVGAQVMLIQNVVQGSLVNGSVGKVVDLMTTHEAMRQQIRVTEQKQRADSSEASPPSKRPRLSTENKLVPLGDNKFYNSQEWPLVQFICGERLLCAPTSFDVVGYMGNVEAQRLQVPLILSWAVSMHKAQGQTLERVKIDFERVFEKGQAYVAVSRATTMENLEIQNFNPVKIQAHPRVLAWHQHWMPTANPEPTTPPQSTRATLRPPLTPQSVPHAHRANAVQRLIDEDESMWDEMDSDDAIAAYHGGGFS